ncbi:hypothetical protein A3H26_01065 [candidate division WWE3 bacterium RIFCSPLOWO2_12_FULL_36_10]|uniref:Thioredoxin domain-containing protein n=1 Tax=candidate division WWE3 bacterium RIFCSPLOWO2_12_FULL_36_10 TaxID=1802630 RepID=A0A1F4VHK3_UNCKA|nr:MAG: hypothetical protein A3H26_01065 [candidate division WWE3 bacterium RIFCSPLOWO2_12_FULL_36_10]
MDETSSKSKGLPAQSGFPTQTVFVFIVVVLLIGAAFMIGTLWTKVQYLENGGTKPTIVGTNNNQPSTPVKLDPITKKDHIRGAKNPKAVIIEYSDLECPFCKSYHASLKQALEEYPNDIAWIYRHFPIASLHPKAEKEAEAVECAFKLSGDDGFWALTDKIFEVTPSNNGLDPTILPDLASQVGLNVSDFQKCLDSGEMSKVVEGGIQSGAKAQVQGTPASFIMNIKTGKFKEVQGGAVPYTTLKQAIETTLAE